MKTGQIEPFERSRLGGLSPPVATPRSVDHRRNQSEVVSPKNKVQVVESLEQGIANLLCHATSDPDDSFRARIFPGTESAQIAVELVLCLVANRTGVDDQDVGGVLGLRGDQAAVMEEIRQFL